MRVEKEKEEEKVDPGTRLQLQAKQHEAPAADEFVFDLDLNPDM